MSCHYQGFGYGLYPDSIRSVDSDPDTYSESGSESRRAKMAYKSRKIKKFHGNLDIFYGGIGVGKL